MRLPDVDNPSGHIYTLLFLIFIGVVCIKIGLEEGKLILVGASANLWPLLRNTRLTKAFIGSRLTKPGTNSVSAGRQVPGRQTTDDD